jgi:hypothetical protein
MSTRKGQEYKAGELEIILSLVPTKENIRWLSALLERDKGAIEVVYKLAYEHGPFGKDATIQERKIMEAKKKLGIAIGRKVARKSSATKAK